MYITFIQNHNFYWETVIKQSFLKHNKLNSTATCSTEFSKYILSSITIYWEIHYHSEWFFRVFLVNHQFIKNSNQKIDMTGTFWMPCLGMGEAYTFWQMQISYILNLVWVSKSWQYTKSNKKLVTKSKNAKINQICKILPYLFC